ncbi:hypothetical protein C8Q78DRAFT_1075057 [Trametes maxima]|nr:hypothetical protein C8Q78DRAFT_1075057 [Trametes maxima]
MASEAASEIAAEISSLYDAVFTVRYLSSAGSTLVLYDFLITFGEEVRLFWGRKFTGASLLFFVNRYWTLLANDIFMPLSFAHVPDSAHLAFSALRVLALSGMNWPLSVATFLLAMGPVAVNLTQYAFGLSASNALTLGCLSGDNKTEVQAEIAILCVPSGAYSVLSCRPASIVSRLTLILSDVLVVVVTLVATWKKGGRSRIGRGTSPSSPLGDIMLYNGLKYFVMLLILNILVMVLSRISTSFQAAEYILALLEPLTAVTISRFLLDLQAANQTSKELGSHTHTSLPEADQSETLQFAPRVLGSLGAETGPGLESVDEDVYFGEDIEDSINSTTAEGARDDSGGGSEEAVPDGSGRREPEKV